MSCCTHMGISASLAFFFITVGCSDHSGPLTPTAATAIALETSAAHHDAAHGAAVSGDKGYIDGWIDGEDVQLYYTRSYFCVPLDEPPPSDTPPPCEIGAPGEVAPRSGPIPTIYAIAAVGFQPDPSTVACRAGTPCLNHPAMIDASRVGGPANATPPSHSHILSQRGGGWFNTVNIRVFSLPAWNEIAAAKTLAKVRELQGDPTTGKTGVISADTPTNIYFFIAGAR